jgi:hypothetical protein
MHKLEVGKLYVQGRTQWPETPEFNWLDSGPELRVFFAKPTPVEVAQFRTGSAGFGLVLSEGIVFMLAKFGTLAWMDAPFHHSMIPTGRRPDLNQEFGPETRALLQSYLVDAATGILRVIRAVSLSPEFTRQLHTLIVEQAKHPMTRGEYEAAVDTAYRNHPITKLMLAKSLITSKGGA